MKRHPFTPLFATIFTLMMIQGVLACGDRPSVWDIELDTAVTQFPQNFTSFACGSNGGPPARVLAGIEAFATCKSDVQGLHEVTFRNDDEREFIARATEQTRGIALCEGTKVMGVPAIISVLVNAAGIIKGIRIVTDPRGVEPTERSEHWAMAINLMRRYGSKGWKCEDLPKAEGETPIANFRQRETCTRQDKDASMRAVSEYYHRAGQAFLNEYGDVQPDYFISESRFEIMSE